MVQDADNPRGNTDIEIAILAQNLASQLNKTDAEARRDRIIQAQQRLLETPQSSNIIWFIAAGMAKQLSSDFARTSFEQLMQVSFKVNFGISY